MKKYALLFSLFFISIISHAQTWATFGAAGFSAGQADFTTIAVDGSGTPYVVYKDYSNGQKASVMKYNGSSWVAVGSPGFSAGVADFTAIAINGSGTPYVVYEDYGNAQKATVMKYNGSAWVNVGSAGFSAGASAYNNIAIDAGGTPYVVYQDDVSTPQKATVMKYNGTAWVNVGSPAFSAATAYSTSIAINSTGMPYVVYGDYATTISGQATSKLYNGSSWVTVGSTGFTSGETYNTTIAIGANDTPYVGYQDFAAAVSGGDATVMKFNGSSWVTVGTAGFSAGAANYIFTAVGANDTPYVVYQDGALGMKATAMKFNGSSWVTVGAAGFSPAEADYTTMAIDGAGSLYVVYQDYDSSKKATVMKFGTPLPPVAGSTALCTGDSSALSDITAGGTWSSSNTSVVIIGSGTGIATGISAGTTTITYSFDTVYVTRAVTVNTSPTAIEGSGRVCIDTTTTLTDAIAGGTWSSSSTSIATIGSATGVVRGISAGTATITYTAPNGCYVTKPVTSGILCGVGVPIIDNNNELEIFPNPATTSLTIFSTNQPISSLAITNLIGQAICTRKYNASQVQVDVSGLPPGVYFIKINGSVVRKFVKG